MMEVVSDLAQRGAARPSVGTCETANATNCTKLKVTPISAYAKDASVKAISWIQTDCGRACVHVGYFAHPARRIVRRSKLSLVLGGYGRRGRSPRQRAGGLTTATATRHLGYDAEIPTQRPLHQRFPVHWPARPKGGLSLAFPHSNVLETLRAYPGTTALQVRFEARAARIGLQ